MSLWVFMHLYVMPGCGVYEQYAKQQLDQTMWCVPVLKLQRCVSKQPARTDRCASPPVETLSNGFVRQLPACSIRVRSACCCSLHGRRRDLPGMLPCLSTCRLLTRSQCFN